MLTRTAMTVAVLTLTLSTAFGQTGLQVPGAFPTIQSAIVAANNGDVIQVAPGTYLETLDFLGKTIEVVSFGGPQVTIIDAAGLGTVVRFVGGEPRATHLEGFTLRGGLGITNVPGVAEGAPGGVLCVASAPTLRNCIIEANSGGLGTGGAIGGAGAISMHANAFPLLEDCILRNNMGGLGVGGPGGPGAVLSVGGMPDMIRTRVENNTGGVGTVGGAGAVESVGGTMVLANDEFHGNTGGAGTTAEGGPGVLRIDSTALGGIVNCILAGNQGGLGVMDISPTVRRTGMGFTGSFLVLHATVADNMPVGMGGSTFEGPMEVRNSILRNPAYAVEFAGPGAVAASNAIGLGGIPNAGNIDAPALFVDPANGDYHLQADSPCRDAADPSFTGLLDLDVDADPRIVNVIPDMGADEVCLDGTMEDFIMTSTINGLGDPMLCVKHAAPGDLLSVGWASPGGTFVGGNVVLLAQIYDPAQGPLYSPLAYQSLQVNAFGAALISVTGMLPAAGDSFSTNALPLPPGITARIQAVVLSAMAANHIYASTRAHDIITL
ncbi:MAG TPA: hypothetical protein ENK43_16990 [Planctomycetes bacterium]|nr:hypothetical protein [Planctomycetota bacterium]